MKKNEMTIIFAKYNKKMIIYKMIKKIISKKVIRIIVPSKFHIKIDYYIRLEKGINFCNPITFNEKLQWLKIYDRKSEYTKMVDKYEVRKYIADTIGEDYLIPLLGVYNDFDEIEFNTFPKQFVMKCTHDSGGIVICTDKSKLDIDAVRKKINKSLKRNYYYHAREWPYKNVKTRIICEKYLVDESGTELKDYKFMCFNGEVKCISVCLNRNTEGGLNIDFYDINWKPMPIEILNLSNSGNEIPKPKDFDRMFEFAEKLSKNIPFVRVDFYETNDQLYFGELTFYPGSGFEKFTLESYDYLLGSWIKLPKK